MSTAGGPRAASRPGAFGPSGDHLNYLFYETDPDVPMHNLVDLSREPDTTASLPEWAWWHFDIDDVTAGKGNLMMSITDATDPDLSRSRHITARYSFVNIKEADIEAGAAGAPFPEVLN